LIEVVKHRLPALAHPHACADLEGRLLNHLPHVVRNCLDGRVRRTAAGTFKDKHGMRAA
jgi:hypothetical protein